MLVNLYTQESKMALETDKQGNHKGHIKRIELSDNVVIFTNNVITLPIIL